MQLADPAVQATASQPVQASGPLPQATQVSQGALRMQKARNRRRTVAEAAEADYPGTNRYHVDISQFDIDVHHLPELLGPPD